MKRKATRQQVEAMKSADALVAPIVVKAGRMSQEDLPALVDRLMLAMAQVMEISRRRVAASIAEERLQDGACRSGLGKRRRKPRTAESSGKKSARKKSAGTKSATGRRGARS